MDDSDHIKDIMDFLESGKIDSGCPWSDKKTVDAVAWLGEDGPENHRTCTEFNVAREYLTPEVLELCLSYAPDINPPPPRPYNVFVRWGNNTKTPLKEYLRSDQFKEDVREKRVGQYGVPLSTMRFLGNMPGQPGLWYRPLIENWDMIATYRVFTPEEAVDPVTAGIMKHEFEANHGELVFHVVRHVQYKDSGLPPIPEDIARDFGTKDTDMIDMSDHVWYRLDAKTGKITEMKDVDVPSRAFEDAAYGSGTFIIKKL